LGAALKVSEGGEIDIDDGGHVVSRFLPELQRDLGLVYPAGKLGCRIATWLCRNLPEPSLTHASKQAFVARGSPICCSVKDSRWPAPTCKVPDPQSG
jgi:type III restriction enzyme